MTLMKRLAAWRPFQLAVGVMAAEYLRLVWKTTRFAVEPEGVYERGEADLPIILGMWHGQHFLVPFVGSHPAKVLFSRHRDGEINAIAAEHLGLGTIRGSGTHSRDFQRKGGTAAFREMLDTLSQGCSMALTADVPKVARVAGLGIVKLAAMSGRPIYLIALATRYRITLSNWDRTVIPLPCGRGGIVGVGPIFVPAAADEATLESARRNVENVLNTATLRAYELAEGTAGGAARG